MFNTNDDYRLRSGKTKNDKLVSSIHMDFSDLIRYDPEKHEIDEKTVSSPVLVYFDEKIETREQCVKRFYNDRIHIFDKHGKTNGYDFEDLEETKGINILFYQLKEKINLNSE